MINFDEIQDEDSYNRYLHARSRRPDFVRMWTKTTPQADRRI